MCKSTCRLAVSEQTPGKVSSLAMSHRFAMVNWKTGLYACSRCLQAVISYRYTGTYKNVSHIKEVPSVLDVLYK